MRALDSLMAMLCVPLGAFLAEAQVRQQECRAHEEHAQSRRVASRLVATDDDLGATDARVTWRVGGQGQTVVLVDTGTLGADEHVVMPGCDGDGSHAARMLACIRMVAPEARVISVDVADTEIRATHVLAALQWVRAQVDRGREVSVVNMSLSLFDVSWPIRDEIAALRTRGVPVVTSAGNWGSPGRRYMLFPAAFFQTISVGAVDRVGRICDFCQRQGAVQYGMHQTDCMAPGRGIWIDGAYTSGTSQASAFVAAAIVLFREVYRRHTGVCPSVDEIETALRYSGPDTTDPETGERFGMLRVPALLDWVEPCVCSSGLPSGRMEQLRVRQTRRGATILARLSSDEVRPTGELFLVAGATCHRWQVMRGRANSDLGVVRLSRGRLLIRVKAAASPFRIYFQGIRFR